VKQVKTSHKLVFALFFSGFALFIMSFTSTTFSQPLANYNNYIVQASYGFPFVFRAIYSNLSGISQTVFSGWALALDFAIIFAVTLSLVVLLTQPMIVNSGKRTAKNKKKA
jgi:hypothetical protein